MPSEGATCAVVYDEITDCISLYGSCVPFKNEGFHGVGPRLNAEPPWSGVDPVKNVCQCRAQQEFKRMTNSLQ